MENLIIVGTSTTARSIYKFVTDYNLFHIMGFVVDKEYKKNNTFCGLPVYDFDNLPLSFNKVRDFLFVAIEWNRLNADRRDIYNRLKEQSFKFANIISPSAIVHGELQGDNCWICDYVVIENDAVVKNDVFVKTKATIAHLSEIASHCFIGANSFLAGNVHVGEQSYIGVSSTIFNSVNIGHKCLIGGGVVVKRHVPDFTVVKTRNDAYVTKTYDEAIIEQKLLASIRIR
jgi:sugar O-acyltransferase (sialic acid O-acetyltransferase NeuD family)